MTDKQKNNSYSAKDLMARIAKNEQRLVAAKEKAEKAISDRKIVLDNLNVGLVYLNKDYVVQWESLNIYADVLGDNTYVEGELCYKTVFGKDKPCDHCPIKRLFDSKTQEFHLLERNGRTLEITANPVFNDDHEIQGGVLKMEDITLRLRQEKELRIAKEKAEESNRLKTAFLANISHEIRTPLNAIVGFSDLLGEIEEREQKHEYIEIIKKNNAILLQLISDILDLSKIEAEILEFQMTTADVNKLCRDAISSFAASMDVHVPVIFEDHLAECHFYTDESRVRQVIFNLISNAQKFTREGDVRVGYHIIDGDKIRFYVKDTGIGIKQENINSIFDRFVKLDSFVQGTGLGLAICKHIVEQMKGAIGVDSEWGKGSCFWFTLDYKSDVT